MKDEHHPSRVHSSSPPKTAIPKLKLSLKLGKKVQQSQAQKGAETPVRLVTEDISKSVLPKITLSVRRSDESKDAPFPPPKAISDPDMRENNDGSNVDIGSNVTSEVAVVKRKRGRPPKNMAKSDASAEPTFVKRQPKTLHFPKGHGYGATPKPLLPAKTNPAQLLEFDTETKGPITANTTIGDAELAKIGRLKGHLASLLESDIETINHADYGRPFSSKQDMIDRLLPFHILSMASLQIPLSGGIKASKDLLDLEMSKLRASFQQFIQSENQQSIPTELRLLEQRLCLEEEKFLLEKMRQEYKRRLVMAGSE